jgi:hypothetical protein
MAYADLKTFSFNIHLLLRRKGVTDEELAKSLDMNLPRVRAWLGEVCYPKSDALVKLCEYFEYYDIFKLFTQRLTHADLEEKN